LLLLIYLYEIFYGPIVGAFCLGVKKTSGKLPVFSVIQYTFTTDTFPAAGTISTITVF